MANPQAEAARQELEWRKCFPAPGASLAARATALIYFVSTYCKMWTKQGGVPIEWELWDCQRKALNDFIFHRLVIILKTRQLGMSWTACAYTLWRVMEMGNVHAYFQSIGLVEVTEQHERIKFMYDNLPDWLKARCELGGKGKKRNDRLSQFANGSAVHLYATTKRSGHGAAPALWVLDEFARNELDVKTMRAVLPAVGDVGQVIIISTAAGLGNVFEETWHQATTEGSQSNWHPIFFPASAHPSYTPEFLEREKLNYVGDETGYFEAYPSSPEEAFQTSSKCPFDSGRIAESKQYIRANNIKPEVGNLILDEHGNIVFVEDKRGLFFVWKHPVKRIQHEPGGPPPQKAHQYTVGADVAEGLIQGDFSAAVVLDTDTNEVVAMLRGKIAPDAYSLPLIRLGLYYNTAWLAFEVNKSADILGRDLKATYPLLYRRERRDRIYDQPTLEVGFYTSGNTKSLIISGLRNEFHSVAKPLKIYSDTILNEMTTYEERPNLTYGASGQNFDDTVMALAIAIEARKSMPYIEDEEPVRRFSSGRCL